VVRVGSSAFVAFQRTLLKAGNVKEHWKLRHSCLSGSPKGWSPYHEGKPEDMGGAGSRVSFFCCFARSLPVLLRVAVRVASISAAARPCARATGGSSVSQGSEFALTSVAFVRLHTARLGGHAL
jgi:hypothetical protein